MTTISGDTGVDKATNQAVKDAMGVTGTAPIFGCRAWVNFDGTRNEADTGASVIGQNVKIRGSGNVSSVLKNGVGDYTVNFITAMPDVNYGYAGGAQTDNAGQRINPIGEGFTSIRTTSLLRITTGWAGAATSDGVLRDSPIINVMIFR